MIKDKLLLVVVVIAFGSIGMIIRNVSFSSAQISMIRGFFGAGFIFLYVFFTKRKLSKLTFKKVLLFIGIGGVIGINWVLLFQAYQYLTISTSTVIYYTAPIFLVIYGYLIFKEKINMVQLLSILMAIIGLALVVDGYQTNLDQQAWIGVTYAFVAAILYASVITSNKILKDVDPIYKTGLQLFGAFLIMFPYVFMIDPIIVNHYSIVEWFLLLLLGIFHTGIAYTIYFSVVGRLKSHTVGIISYLDPLSAIFFAWLFLSESMGLVQIAGTILILSATFISELKFNRK